MQKTEAIIHDKKTVLSIIQFIAFVAIVTFAPLIKNQFIVGPIVNATLFISVETLGLSTAIMVGLIPSVIALSVGLLPPLLAPIIPFIMISNAIMVSVFEMLKKRNYYLGIVSASILKYLFLFASSSIAINLLMKKNAAHQVAVMMSWPQLVTALIGGILALLFFKALKTKTK